MDSSQAADSVGRMSSARSADAGIAPDSSISGTAHGGGAPSTWTVSAVGIGPVRAGMTLAEAGRALGVPLSADSASCTYVRPPGVPVGVSFMIVDGRVARVDVDSGAVRTTAGAGIGDSETRVRSLYAGRVAVQPQKYTAGHSLVVTPRARADSAYRLIFETDSGVVTRYRAGALPAVAWVERCG